MIKMFFLMNIPNLILRFFLQPPNKHLKNRPIARNNLRNQRFGLDSFFSHQALRNSLQEFRLKIVTSVIQNVFQNETKKTPKNKPQTTEAI